jgi:hypothetical protein
VNGPQLMFNDRRPRDPLPLRPWRTQRCLVFVNCSAQSAEEEEMRSLPARRLGVSIVGPLKTENFIPGRSSACEMPAVPAITYGFSHVDHMTPDHA